MKSTWKRKVVEAASEGVSSASKKVKGDDEDITSSRLLTPSSMVMKSSRGAEASLKMDTEEDGVGVETEEITSSSDPRDTMDEFSGLKSQLLMDFGLESKVSEEVEDVNIENVNIQMPLEEKSPSTVSDSNVGGGQVEKEELKSKISAECGIGNDEDISEKNDKLDKKESEAPRDNDSDEFTKEEEESIVHDAPDDQIVAKKTPAKKVVQPSRVEATGLEIMLNADCSNPKDTTEMNNNFVDVEACVR